MQIQDFSNQQKSTNSQLSIVNSQFIEAVAASFIFLLPILVLFALSVNQ